MREHRLAVVLAPLLLVAAAAIAAADPTACTTPLPECTQARVAQLTAQSRALAQAAREAPGRPLGIAERRQLEQYNRWLETQSRHALELARRGSEATSQEAQMSFNLQYVQLQSQMQQENQSYAAVSRIMKSKHDTVKNSVSNIR